MSFVELGLSQPLLRAIVAEGYSSPTPIQSRAIPQVLEGRDLLGCAQTGTGKTAAFALPILNHFLQALPAAPAAAPRPQPQPVGARPRYDRRQPMPSSPCAVRGLVLAPTRELAAQIGDSFRTYGRFTRVRSTVVYGGVSQIPQVKALRQGVELLVATPGRLLDLMEQGYVQLGRVEVLVLDEADQMLDMGFLPSLKRIVSHIPRQRQTLLFSATMPAEIRSLADSWLQDPVEIKIVPAGTPTELVQQTVVHVEPRDKARLLEHYLRQVDTSRTLVFTRTKRGADKVVQQLELGGFRAAAIHGNKSQNFRQRVLAEFRSSRPPVLVATDIAARGLDIDGVSHVFNFDMPIVPEIYVHRIGRTGRAGAAGCAISFCGREEVSLLRQIERLTRRTIAVELNQLAPSSPPERERIPHPQQGARTNRPHSGTPAGHRARRAPSHRAATRQPSRFPSR